MSPLKSRHLSTLRRSSIGALALAMTLGLSACGGGDDDAAAAAQESSAQAGAAAPSMDDMVSGAAAEGEADHMAGMSAEEHAAMDAEGEAGHSHADMTFPELEKEAAIPAGAEFNFQDVYFSQHMVAHHGQAVEMAEMLLASTKNPAMKKLGTAIAGAQSPEIELMTGWLKSWKQSTENAPHAHDPNAPSAGMMTDDDMGKLHKLKGRAFDKLFLQQMIFHHTGAVNQSNKELKNGKYAATKKLAQAIIKAQTKEIALMKELLKTV